MIEVMSGDHVTIRGIEKIIPYFGEPQLSKKDLKWLKLQNIKVTILKKRRKSWAYYNELLCHI